MLKKSIFSCLATGALVLSANTALADTYATALFDNTGSMRITRTVDGLSRCEFGKQLFMETLKSGINKADYLDVRWFATPGQVVPISAGFVNVKGLNASNGAGKAFYDEMATKVNNLPCNGSSTALGDAVCETIDSLRAKAGSGHTLRVGLVTDADENSSRICGGNDYVQNKIVPKAFQSPFVRFDISIFTRPGNVDRSLADVDWLEEEAPLRSRHTRGIAEEIQSLEMLAELSGGEAVVITDTEECIKGCSPLDDVEAETTDSGDWGGGW